MQVQHEIGNLFAKNTNGKIKIRVIHDPFKLKSAFRVKEDQVLLHIGQMRSTSTIFIAYAAATTLMRLSEICLHDSTTSTSAPKNVKSETLPTIFMKIPTIKLTLQNLKTWNCQEPN